MRSPYTFVLSCFSTVLANLQLDIDCDRETERIFSLLSSNDTKLQNMEGQCLFLNWVHLSEQAAFI